MMVDLVLAHLLCKFSIEVLAHHCGPWGNLVPIVLLTFGASAKTTGKDVIYRPVTNAMKTNVKICKILK